MKKRTIFITIGIVIVILLSISLITMRSTYREAKDYMDNLPEGEEAIAAMSETEKEYFDNKISKIETGMTKEDVIEILGAPAKEGINLADHQINYWICPENGEGCQIRVKIYYGEVFQVQWLKMDSFYYSKMF